MICNGLLYANSRNNEPWSDPSPKTAELCYITIELEVIESFMKCACAKYVVHWTKRFRLLSNLKKQAPNLNTYTVQKFVQFRQSLVNARWNRASFGPRKKFSPGALFSKDPVT